MKNKEKAIELIEGHRDGSYTLDEVIKGIYNLSEDELKNEPAFPSQSGVTFNNNEGMSKRLYIATMAMQGLIAVGYTNEVQIAEQAFKQANALLEQENLFYD